MIRKFTCALLMTFTGLIAGCSDTTEDSYSARDAQVELDLSSLVRLQSNELLTMTEQLQAFAKRDFSSSRNLARNLEETVSHMDQIHMNLPTLLAAQDVEIADMRQQVADGQLDKSTLKARASDVQTYRKALIASLDASAGRTIKTLDALNAAQRGDLNLQTRQTSDLARDLKAARTMIEMQL